MYVSFKNGIKVTIQWLLVRLLWNAWHSQDLKENHHLAHLPNEVVWVDSTVLTSKKANNICTVRKPLNWTRLYWRCTMQIIFQKNGQVPPRDMLRMWRQSQEKVLLKMLQTHDCKWDYLKRATAEYRVTVSMTLASWSHQLWDVVQLIC